MNDMSGVIIPKSDQINADDLIAGPRTITIVEVQISGGQEQPVSIYFEGDKRAFRPCKSMSRVLVQAWGPDAKQYIGRSLTLYRDPTVKWAGMEVGGVRISHMSHIDCKQVMQLTATRGQRKPHIVHPLTDAPKGKPDKVADGVTALLARIQAEDVAAVTAEPDVVKQRAWLAKNRPELAAQIDEAIAAKTVPADDDDPFSDPGTTDNLDRIRTDIDACKSADALAELRAEFDALEVSEDVRADMEQRFADMGRALERGDG